MDFASVKSACPASASLTEPGGEVKPLSRGKGRLAAEVAPRQHVRSGADSDFGVIRDR
jgi:hypothetical protein